MKIKKYLHHIICAACFIQLLVIPNTYENDFIRMLDIYLYNYMSQGTMEEPMPEEKPPDDQAENETSEELTEEPVIEKRPIYLTFDDGPSANMESLLDILEEYNVKATFFMLEPNVRKYPESVKRAYEEGHALGSHSVSHKVEEFYKSTDSMLWEMAVTAEAIEAVTGQKSWLIRVPYGSVPYLSNAQKQIFAEEGYKLWDWNVDSLDWKYKNEDYCAHTIKQIEALREKNLNPVVLMHDLKTTAAYLPQLLEYLNEQGYECLPLNEEMQEVQFQSTY